MQLGRKKSFQYNAKTNATAQLIIKNIFQLEHQILDEMTQGATRTTEYVIYYTGKSQNEINRGIIKAKDLYASNALSVDREGNVILKQTVTQLKKFQQINISNIANIPEYQEIAKIITAYLTSISEQYQNILNTARETHLGFNRDRMHDALRQVNSEGESVENYMRNVYARYINAVDQGMVNIKISGLLNRGHLVEAYERLLRLKTEQNADQPFQTTYLALLQESLGNDPWYIGGDVGSAQVKSFLDNAYSRQVASLNSILELGRRLIQLVTAYDKTMASIKRQEDKFKTKMVSNGAQTKLDNLYEEEIEFLLKEFSKFS